RSVRERATECIEQPLLGRGRGLGAPVHGQAALVQPQLRAIAESNKRIARKPFAAFHAFQQKTRSERLELEVRRHRRIQVSSNVKWRFQAKLLVLDLSPAGRREATKKPIPGLRSEMGSLDSSAVF